MKKLTELSGCLIWFGAAVSVAEILTGALIAPLGMAKGALAVVLGHIIGCALLFLSGLIGGETGKCAMDTVKMSFGNTGAKFFAFLNILQLAGWTAVMISNGAAAANGILNIGEPIWDMIIGVLIILYILAGINNIEIINYFAMASLFALTVIMGFAVFGGGGDAVQSGEMSFGAAVELSAAMPISWLPLISDYSCRAIKPRAFSAAGSIVYFAASCVMYLIGLGAAIFAGNADIAVIMQKAGLGAEALAVIVFSTVTTTFLDVYSAGVSSESMWKRIKEKPAAAAVGIAGILLAIFTKTSAYEDFLYFIGSVFSPMIAIQITDYFILKKDSTQKRFDAFNIIIWAIGFVIYRIFMKTDTPIGSTAPAMASVCVICVLADFLRRCKRND